MAELHVAILTSQKLQHVLEKFVYPARKLFVLFSRPIGSTAPSEQGVSPGRDLEGQGKKSRRRCVRRAVLAAALHSKETGAQ